LIKTEDIAFAVLWTVAILTGVSFWLCKYGFSDVVSEFLLNTLEDVSVFSVIVALLFMALYQPERKS
jgi:di/tricarboxylate transporter